MNKNWFYNMDGVSEELRNLIAAYCDGACSPAERDRLEKLLDADEAAQYYYLMFTGVHAQLLWRSQGRRDEAKQLQRLAAEARSPATWIGSLGPTCNGMFDYFSQTGRMGLMLAVSCVLLLAGYMAWNRTASNRQFASASHAVGRITGMVDCQWSNPAEAAHLHHDVPHGQEFALKSGLLEITYNSGAKVILQGPATFIADSNRGGLLTLGKLTALVQNNSAAEPIHREQGDPSRPHSLFIVRTPTAVLTDLGTEFGVEVDREGGTLLRVFRGLVKCVLWESAPDDPKGAVVLRSNESVRTKRSSDDAGHPIVLVPETNDHEFVRNMPSPPIDLLDIVAEGDGDGRRRDRGINPATGAREIRYAAGDRVGDGKYHRLDWNKLIDGVFIPDGRKGSVVLDSAGHAFDGFPTTANTAFGPIWARAASFENDDPKIVWKKWNQRYPFHVMGRGEEFMPEKLGILGLHPNAGITFDLEAIRAARPGIQPVRFRGVFGMGDASAVIPPQDRARSSYQRADAWVFVDGRLKWNRSHLGRKDGPLAVSVDLEPHDRFLTVVSTDSGGDASFDYVVLGDPVLDGIYVNNDGS